ncbi:hypothetical protein [Pararhizobium qamdonense]|uniref:hypothetical protein n=1 Tax=Pararhizobium qamdonense TaxID=3031126 RepID=UPI0023E2A8B3|nr:hypothetical protein [Pararhizobium qamdonense]
MWINLDDQRMTLIESALARRISGVKRDIERLMDGNQALNKTYIDGLTETQKELQAALDHFGEARKDFDPADPYRAAAQGGATDELEIDDDAIVSPGSDPGAWVHAWVWVTNDDAGVETKEDEDD